MSASPMARQVTENRSISIPTRKVLINDPSELPQHYASTPGGTLYSTTPGGTKIVYEKAFLLNLRNSPISKTPPSCNIPDALMKGSPNKYGGSPKYGNSPNKYSTSPSNKYNNNHKNNNSRQTKPSTNPKSKSNADEDQFQLEL